MKKESSYAAVISALADCYYHGQRYAEGTQVGPYVCVAGKWVVRN